MESGDFSVRVKGHFTVFITYAEIPSIVADSTRRVTPITRARDSGC